MAVIYLRSTDGSDTDDGSTWALAKATLAAALTAAGAGGTVYVSDNHAETQATAMTLTSPGTAASPVLILCVDDIGNPQPPTALATTATVTNTSTSATSLVGFAFCYGVTFVADRGFACGDTTPLWWRYEACAFTITGAGATYAFTVGILSANADDSAVELVNTTMTFAHVGQGIKCYNRLTWRNTASAIGGATVPTALFLSVNALAADVLVSGVDLSALGSGKNLITGTGAAPHTFRFENCKLGASVSIVTGAIPGQGGAVIEVVRCASGATNYDYYKQTYQGTITQEATIVRTGGASDGTTPISRKMVSSANTKYYSPLVLGDLAAWNETTGSAVTATVEVVTDGVTLTDAQAWLEAEYLGSALTPVSSLIDDAAADVLATPANQTTSTAAWTTTGLASPVKQKLSVTFTPNMKGPIRFRVMLAKASTTVYVCPKVDLT